MKRWTKYQIIYEACKEATKRQMKVHNKTWSTETMLLYPKDYCSFKAFDVEQNIIKNFNAYMRRHHVQMGLVPLHSPGGFARYMFENRSLIEELLNDALTNTSLVE